MTERLMEDELNHWEELSDVDMIDYLDQLMMGDEMLENGSVGKDDDQLEYTQEQGEDDFKITSTGCVSNEYTPVLSREGDNTIMVNKDNKVNTQTTPSKFEEQKELS